MLEKWRRTLEKREYISALFMDLSKAFDTINHDLLIAKLKAYGFSKETVKLMKSYLKNNKQKVQVNKRFSSERDVIAGGTWRGRRTHKIYAFFRLYDS